MISQISRALETNRFCLYFQNIGSITSNQSLEPYEILLRMLDKNGESVAPNEFILSAECYGLITKRDCCWVIETFLSNYHNLSELKVFSKDLYTITISGASSRVFFIFLVRFYAVFDVDVAVSSVSYRTFLGIPILRVLRLVLSRFFGRSHPVPSELPRRTDHCKSSPIIRMRQISIAPSGQLRR
ncbi:EAL domain-containing protein [Microcoleus vaginatus]|uniref:EAL domain-containing protein n=1 Tax=Microcoleus vaginatus TaxID=119532 RepID=UPI0032A79960